MTKTEFQNLVIPSRDKLYRVALSLLRDRQDAEDALQEVYLKLWRMRRKLAAYNSVEALAVTMIKNLCLDQLRSYRNRKQDGRELETMSLSSATRSPERSVEISESLETIHRLVGELPDRQRMILHLRDIEHYEYEEIADMTGLTVNNIRVTLSRARKSVREAWQNHQNYEHRTN